MVAGCTGYIGRFVTKELIKRGYQVVAFSREKSGVGGKKSMDDVKSEYVLRLRLSVWLRNIYAALALVCLRVCVCENSVNIIV
jgi:nucleoside-diphosphate-sugar epimerase